MSKIRKAFVVSIMMMTVLSMSVVVAPQAEAASAGDLIKMNGLSSVYYLGADGKRYVFPNESTYFSWYEGFASVVTVAQSELESYPLGKNVTVRPGTKLVKITTDPKVYAVEPNGTLLWVPSEAVAKTLYGDMWAKRVIDVADSFFTNYNVTGEQVSADAYPAGSLVKYGEDATVYWIGTDAKAYPFASEAAFLANRFKWADVINATIAKPAVGDAITAAIAAVIDTSSGAGGSAGAGTGLTVSLSGDTPGSANIPSKSTLVPFLAVNLTASNDGAVTVQQLTFVRKGTGNASDFDGGYLFVGNERLSNKRSVNTSDNTVTFSALNLSIPAGQSKTVTLKMNADAGVTGNHYFELASAAAVSTNGAVVSGAFPIEGNLMSYASVNAATVEITGTMGATAERKVGETDVVLAEFDIQNDNSATEMVNFYSIRLKNNGDASDDAIGNMSLVIDGTVVASDVDMVNDFVTFTLDTPVLIDKSESVTAEIRGDVLSDVNKTVAFYLKEVGDADIRGTAYGDFYGVTIVNRLDINETDTTAALGSDEVTNNDTVITVKGSEINVSFDGPSAADVKDDNKNVVFANFKIKSESEDVDIDTLTVTLAQGGANNGYPLENFELVDGDNNVVYAADSAPASSTSQGIAFSNILLSAGTQYNFEIQGDIQNNTPAGSTFLVSINFASGFTATYVQSDTAVTVATDLSSQSLTGKTMTVAAPSLTVAKVTTNAISTVKDADGVLLYKGKMTANNVDNIKVSRVVADFTTGDLSANTISSDWEKVSLYKVNSDGTETLLDSETSLGVDQVAFSSFTLEVPKGVNNGVYFVVRGDVKSNPVGTTTEVAMASSGWTIKDSDNNTVASTDIATAAGHVTTVVTKGSITVLVDTEESGINNDKNVLAGTTALIGRVKLTAANEAAELEDLVITNFGSATNQTLGQVCLYEDKAMTELVQCADVDGSKRAFFQDLSFEVPTTGVTYLYIGAKVKGVDYSNSPAADSTGVAGNTVRLYVPADAATYDFKATGKSTGEELVSPFAAASSTVWTKEATVMGAIISGLSTSFANGVLTAGTAKDVFSFKVTVPESDNTDHDGAELGAELGTITFTVSTSSYSISNIRVERVGGSNGEQSGAGFTNPTATGFAIDFETAYGTDSDLIIRPGDTAEYVVRADVAGTADSGSVQVTIETVDTYVTYDHNYGVAGVQGSDVTDVAPRISGVTNVRGGTLSK